MSDDYPKVIDIDGLKVTVASADEEARWRDAPPQSEAAEPLPDVLDDPDGVPPADPLDDVSIEMDNPAFQPPATSTQEKA